MPAKKKPKPPPCEPQCPCCGSFDKCHCGPREVGECGCGAPVMMICGGCMKCPACCAVECAGKAGG